MSSFDQPSKNQIRDLVCRISTHGKKYKCILLMPSAQCLDIKLLLSNGVIDADTFVVAIEQNEEIALRIEYNLRSYGIKDYRVVRNKLHRVELFRISRGRMFDFVYLDTCSQMNKFLVEWLCDISQSRKSLFTDNCDFWLSYCNACRRGKRFMRYLKAMSIPRPGLQSPFYPAGEFLGEWSNTGQEDEHRVVHQLLEDLFGVSVYNAIYKNEESRWVMHLFHFAGVRPRRFIDIIKFLCEYDDAMTVRIKLVGIKGALKRNGMTLITKRRINATKTFSPESWGSRRDLVQLPARPEIDYP